MNNQRWEELYKLAVLEVDGRKMPERICVARQAIVERLRTMEGDMYHLREREKIEVAVRALKMLTTETQVWR